MNEPYVEEILFINSKLVQLYGRDVSVSLPNYQIVWTTAQYEWRNNDPAGFEIYSDDGLWLRTEFGPHEVEKYPLHPDKWVLEALMPKSAIDSAILVDGKNYSYEPLWIFGAANSNPNPIWKAVNFLVHSHKFKTALINKSSPRDLLREEALKLAKEKEECKTYLRNENPLLAAQLHAGEAVVVPGKFGHGDNDGK